MYQDLAIMAAFVLAYSVAAGRIDKMPLSGPIIYVAFGLVMSPLFLGLLNLNVDTESLRLLAELTLALVLFTDAANADLGVLRKGYGLPVRLLLVGLPLTIVAGFGVGWALFPGLSLFEVAILATMLAPTDAALGEAVVENESVPARIREALNVESGLNDGICVPILFVFVTLVTDTGTEGTTRALAMRLVAEEIGIGAAVGLALAFVGGWLLRQSSKRGWIDDVWRQIPVVALSLACFATAQVLGGSGFIAAFCGGLLFGARCRDHKTRLLQAAQGTGDTFALLTWVVFGAAMVGQLRQNLTLPVLGYAVLSLTLVRMVPVALSVLGLGLSRASTLFLGWFGPRGLASVVFGVIVFDAGLPGGERISAVVVCTITLSIIAHGISANPLVRRYAASSQPAEATLIP